MNKHYFVREARQAFRSVDKLWRMAAATQADKSTCLEIKLKLSRMIARHETGVCGTCPHMQAVRDNRPDAA